MIDKSSDETVKYSKTNQVEKGEDIFVKYKEVNIYSDLFDNSLWIYKYKNEN